jgi:hypothetical protein
LGEANDGAVTIATEIAKQIPVRDIYEDAMQPGAKAAGSIVEDLAKTLHLVLAPFQLTAALQDRFREFVNRSIRSVPEKDRIAPPPQILGPVLEGIRYEPEGTAIDEMFQQLLSSSMHTDKVHDAHPAFPLLIKQISADEAKLLNAMWELHKNGGAIKQQFTQRLDAKLNRFFDTLIEVDEIPRDLLQYPHNSEFYGQHLYALGLTAFYDSANQEPLYANGRSQAQTGVRVFKEMRFTDLGLKFMRAVAP